MFAFCFFGESEWFIIKYKANDVLPRYQHSSRNPYVRKFEIIKTNSQRQISEFLIEEKRNTSFTLDGAMQIGICCVLNSFRWSQ
jgi:hypothetical protein